MNDPRSPGPRTPAPARSRRPRSRPSRRRVLAAAAGVLAALAGCSGDSNDPATDGGNGTDREGDGSTTGADRDGATPAGGEGDEDGSTTGADRDGATTTGGEGDEDGSTTGADRDGATTTGGEGDEDGSTAGDGDGGTATGDPSTDLDLREANVTGVEFERRDGAYEFSVTLYHDDDGEEGYADWWQVETTDGTKLGRRTLLHAHGTREFTRSGTVELPDGTGVVVVRGHDRTHGYGGQAALVTLESGAVEYVRQGPEPRSFSNRG